MVKVETRLEKFDDLRRKMVVMENSTMLVGTNEREGKCKRGYFETRL